MLGNTFYGSYMQMSHEYGHAVMMIYEKHYNL